MKRVALICDYSLEYLGGAQSAFLDEAAILREHGHEVTIIAPTVRSGVGSNVPDVPIPARWVLPGVGLPVVRNSRTLRQRLKSVFEEHAIDVVHVHSEFGLTAAAVSVAADLGIPVAHTVHTFFWQGPEKSPFDRVSSAAVRLFARWLRGAPTVKKVLAPRLLDSALRGITLTAALRAHTVISPSAHQAAALREAGVENVVVVPNAAPAADTAASALTEIDGPLRVAWVARLTPEKRILQFIDAVLLAADAVGPDALEVTIVGDGPLLPRAREIVATRAAAPAAGLVRFVGRVDRDQVRTIMRDSHLVALTSLGFDNQPVIVVEAFNEARSVLYVDSALQEGLSEAGILCEPADAQGMSQTLIDLVRHPDRVISGSRRALIAAEQFSPAAHVRALERIYSDPETSPAEAE